MEDFNTSGLTGDPAETNPAAETRNHFYNFFRAEGVSGKTGKELGRWGVGKFVFPRSSRASSHFAITVRQDDGRRLMLGAATLKGHHVDGGTELFTPDALYGERRGDGLVLPIEDDARIDEVAHLFGIERDREPGTSIIVPFIEKDDFTFETLLRAVVGSYFVPILQGRLEVVVQHDGRETSLRAGTLVAELEAIPEVSPDVLPLVRLATHAATVVDEDRIVLDMPDPKRSANSATWTGEIVDEETLSRLREKLSGSDPVSVRVPVTVRRKSDGDTESYFDIHLQPERNCKARPVFVREGIIVSGVRDRHAREMHVLVMVDDKPLAEMLGDSENPAHTEWQHDGSNFKGRYTHGSGLIKFVTHSVSHLLDAISQSAREPDPTLTIDFFSIEPRDDVDDVDGRPKPRKKPGPDSEHPKPDIKPRPSRIAIQRGKSGFTVEAGKEPPPTPFMLEVKCAYETRSGNPLKKWNKADFMLGHHGLPVVLSGQVKPFIERENRLLLRVEGDDFRVTVDGFDTNRDVYVRANVKEAGDADSQV